MSTSNSLVGANISRLARSCSLLVIALLFLPIEDLSAAVVRPIVSENGDPILYPSYLKEYRGQLYFRANNLRTGNNVELWAFDGTYARMVADINPGSAGSDPSYPAVYNDTLYFCASRPRRHEQALAIRPGTRRLSGSRFRFAGQPAAGDVRIRGQSLFPRHPLQQYRD